MSSNLAAPADVEPLVKRRRLRKGTHSCWHCKKRKVKCVPDPLVDGGPCDECRRRGSRCVGQECPENVSLLATPTLMPDHTSMGITTTANTNRLSEPPGCTPHQSGEKYGETTPAKAALSVQSNHQNGFRTPVSTVSRSSSPTYLKAHEVGIPRFEDRLLIL